LWDYGKHLAKSSTIYFEKGKEMETRLIITQSRLDEIVETWNTEVAQCEDDRWALKRCLDIWAILLLLRGSREVKG